MNLSFSLPESIPHPYKVTDNPEFTDLVDAYATYRCESEHASPAPPCERHLRLSRANLELMYEKQVDEHSSS